MLTLLKSVDLYSPEPRGKKDILVADRRIAAIEDCVDLSGDLPGLEVVDCSGLLALPGLIDGHVHITGGGGEGGFATRTPEIEIADMKEAGVTSLVGVRGTDGFTRSMENLVAKAKAIRGQGFSCWVLTGSYQVPVRTLTGDIASDIMLIEEIIGVGEIAVSDHRSSHPGTEELISLVSAARVGGMLSAKAGVVILHMGDGRAGFNVVRRIIDHSDIPKRHLLPTHVNRNWSLLEKGFAWAKAGGFIDLTTSGFVAGKDDPRTQCSRALKLALDNQVPVDRISFSSDGQGSLPVFSPAGDIVGVEVGSCRSLLKEVKTCVNRENISLETALKPVTQTPAGIYGLSGKGRIETGFDADIVLTDRDLTIRKMMALGRFL